MSLRYELTGGVIRFETLGDVDFADGLATLGRAVSEAAASQPQLRWGVLFDIRHSSENRSAAEMRGIAEFVRSQLGTLSGRCAIVATDALRFGMARMFEAMSDARGVEVKVVTTLESAEAWLQEGE